jgi:methyl-accepting chemotaxis protein
LFFKHINFSFRVKLLLSLFGLNLIVGSIIIFIAHNDIVNSQKDLIEQNISNLGSRLAEQFKPALDFDDKETVAEITEGVLINPDTESVIIWKVDPFNKLFSDEKQTPSQSNSSSLEFFFGKEKQSSTQIKGVVPPPLIEDYIEWKKNGLELGKVIYSGEVIFGYLLLKENLNRFNSFENNLRTLLFTSLLLYLILTILISLWVERALTKPLSELVNVAERVSLKNDLLVRARKISNDEFGKLTTVFNNMLDSIRDTNEALLNSNKEMENRVIERTKDLDDTNKKLQLEITRRMKNSKQLLSLQNKMGYTANICKYRSGFIKYCP